MSNKPKHGDHPSFRSHDGKADDGKLRFGLQPPLAERERAAVLTFGAIKYGAHSWSGVPNGIERYTDAAGRHWHAYRCGDSLDQESHLMHLAHLSVCIDFLMELEMRADPMGLKKSFHDRFEAAKAAARKLCGR